MTRERTSKFIQSIPSKQNLLYYIYIYTYTYRINNSSLPTKMEMPSKGNLDLKWSHSFWRLGGAGSGFLDCQVAKRTSGRRKLIPSVILTWLWKITSLNIQINYFYGPFSIAMLNYQRVYIVWCNLEFYNNR